MSIDITLPQLGTVKKSTKDLVISTLLYEHPLNLAKITNSIKKKYSASVTFQGVRRVVNQLVEDGVVVKEGKQYFLNKDWILRLRDFVEQLQDAYFTESTGIKDIEAIGEEIKVYTFDTLIDLDKFWNKMVGKWYDDDAADKSDKLYLQLSRTWYVLAQLQEETAIVEKMRKYNIKFYIVAPGHTFLDKWCQTYYEKLNCKYLTTDKETDPARYFSVYKDLIIQTTYPKELANEIDAVYKSTKNFESFEVVKLIQILRKKADLKVTVMKNPVVAEQLRNFVLEHF